MGECELIDWFVKEIKNGNSKIKPDNLDDLIDAEMPDALRGHRVAEQKKKDKKDCGDAVTDRARNRTIAEARNGPAGDAWREHAYLNGSRPGPRPPR